MTAPRRSYAPTKATRIALAALRQGPLMRRRPPGGRLSWCCGNRVFSGFTVGQLLTSGLAIREGNRIVLASPSIVETDLAAPAREPAAATAHPQPMAAAAGPRSDYGAFHP